MRMPSWKNAGSRGLALRTADGSIAWGDDRRKSACVSAVPYEHVGSRGVMVGAINDDRSLANLVGVDPSTGRELWRFDGWQEKWGAMGVDPVIHEGKIFITSAEQYRQAARFTIADGTLKLDWSTNRVAGYTGCAVLLGRQQRHSQVRRLGTSERHGTGSCGSAMLTSRRARAKLAR